MARCVHETLIPVYNPFVDTHVGGPMSYFTETHWVCGCHKSWHCGMGCPAPKLKVQCSYYRPESVANWIPEKTEDRNA